MESAEIWLIRYQDGRLYGFTKKPKKDICTNQWGYPGKGDLFELDSNLFPSVKPNKQPVKTIMTLSK